MKTMRKVLSVLLVLAMILSLGAMAVSAAGNGTITVQKAVEGHTYRLYKVFDLTYSEVTTSEGTEKHAAYTYTSKGTEDVSDQFLTNMKADTSPFDITLNPGTNPEVYNVVKKEKATDEQVLEFLTKNAGNLKELAGEVEKYDPATHGNPLTFTNLDYGYYYMTSTVGTLVSIDNATPNAQVTEKNEVPTVTKTPDKLHASVGETINFNIDIVAYEGAENYVLTDTMTDGLTLDQNSIVVMDVTNKTQLTVDTHYTLVTNEHGFTLTFLKTYLDTVRDGQKIEVNYSAVINEKAVVLDKVTNTAKLDYGTQPGIETTPTSTTTTYTYGFTLRKIEKVNDVKKDLAGAKFKLYREVTVDDQKVNQEVKLCEDNGFYRPVVTTKPVGSPADAPVDAIDAGTAVIKGLALGTYYLEETEAPAGYNKLTEMVKLELKPGATDGEVDVMVAGPDGQPVAAENDTVEVLNQTGTPLPSTGGMGTTMFYVLGAVLVLGAAIARVAKRRVREQ